MRRASPCAASAPDNPGGPERTRTSDLRFRKPLLYPAELRDQLRNFVSGYFLGTPFRSLNILLHSMRCLPHSTCGGLPQYRLAQRWRDRGVPRRSISAALGVICRLAESTVAVV